ncbi:GDSL-type esterase/lipase family protein [Streptomyces yaizuensis]|uniref:GDSL-type esterase/lipase family protein n=1 Tax=Streptomyces yaizuensis TaxID=2989713 RepID=A0ABQ5NU30_9ACTN|nr:GDSL-type esterase/lipase family protein [Streptomyces sp. YSPA8]
MALAAAAVLTTGTLTACDASSDSQTHGAPAKKRTAPVWNRSPDSIAAVGDSITRAFDACLVLSDCPEASWATGTDKGVRSLAMRLIGGEPATIAQRSWNFARTGAQVADLTRQMTQAGKRRPELVTVLVGANDACAQTAGTMTPVADFRASFSGAMRELRRTAPKAQVYVSSVPDLHRLWATGKDDPLGRAVWKLGICSSMLGDAEDTSARAERRRADVQERVVAYNDVLKDICAKDTRCRYDGGAVFDYRFGEKLLSRWDWFHPSKDGQGVLADIAYRNITAERPPV